MKWLKPDKVILLGDIVDCYSISSFTRDPERASSLKEELDQGAKFIDKIVHTCPNAEVIYELGNHEDRLRKTIWNVVPAFKGLITFEEKLHLDKHNIKSYDYGFAYVHNAFLYIHGNKVNKHSAYTAKVNYADLGMSGIGGHTHRAGTYYKTDWDGEHEFAENGCLCKLSLSEEWFHKPVPDWQHAFSIVYFDQDKFHVDQIVIPRKKFIIYHKKMFTL
jgi:hypothetical protein